MTARLIFIRHGQTPANVLGRLDTAVPGLPLTDLGVRQAAALPAELVGEELARIAVSTLLRTRLTAQPLADARGIVPTIHAGLREIGAGDLEMRSDEASVRTYVETAFGWAQGDLGRRLAGGEDGFGFYRRYDAAVAAVAEPGTTTAVVSHGAAIRVWLAGRVVDREPAWFAERPLANTARVVVTGSPDTGWEVERWDELPAGGIGSTPSAADPTGAATEDAPLDER